MKNKQQFEQDLLSIIQLSTKLLEHIKNYTDDLHISNVNRTATILIQLCDLTAQI